MVRKRLWHGKTAGVGAATLAVMSPANPDQARRCGLLTDEVSQLLYLKDSLLSGDRLAQRRAITLVAAGPGGALLADAITALLARRHDIS
jgi:hypothetical protein